MGGEGVGATLVVAHGEGVAATLVVAHGEEGGRVGGDTVTYQHRHPFPHTTPSSAPEHSVTQHNAAIRLCTSRSRTHRCPTNTVILREVAVSMVACRGRWLLWLKHWQREMDSATARGMTKLECCGYFGKGVGRGNGFRDCAGNDEVGVLRVLWE